MSAPLIPKIIWQTHEWEYSDLPQNFLSVTMTWKNLNPDWEYRYVSAKERAEYVKNANPSLYKMYLLSDNVSQADMWRYLVTYEHGGVYADMDSICTMPLNYLIENNQHGADLIATPVEYPNNFVNNSNFAVTKSSTLMEKVIRNLVFYYERVNYARIIMDSNTEKEFWEQVSKEIKLHTGVYIDVVFIESPSLVSFNFIGAIHSEGIKNEFNTDYDVDYYGEKTTYFELAKKYGWETHITLQD